MMTPWSKMRSGRIGGSDSVHCGLARLGPRSPRMNRHEYRHLCRANRWAPASAGSVRSRYTRASTSVSCRVYHAQACIQPSSRGSEDVADRHTLRPGVNLSRGQRVAGSLESQELQLGKPDPESSG
jgi:hypothetical protein